MPPARTSTSGVPAVVIDPDIPADARNLLLEHPEFLVPASQPPPPEPLPGRASILSPEQTLLGGVPALVLMTTLGAMIGNALGGVLTEAIVAITCAAITVFGLGLLAGWGGTQESPAGVAARLYHGRYILADDLDHDGQALLLRARQAVADVHAAAVNRTRLVDAIAHRVVLDYHLWEVARTLHRHTALRVGLEEIEGASPLAGPARELADGAQQALARSRASVVARVEALERLADRVRAADTAYQEKLVVDSLGRHEAELRDLAAGTVTEHMAVAEVDDLAARVDAAARLLRDGFTPTPDRPAEHAPRRPVPVAHRRRYRNAASR